MQFHYNYEVQQPALSCFLDDTKEINIRLYLWMEKGDADVKVQAIM